MRFTYSFFVLAWFFVLLIPKTHAQLHIQVDTASGCVPFAVNFTLVGQPPSGVSGYVWDFGDGSNSVLQQPGHIYTTGGNYNVSVRLLTSGSPITLSLPFPIRAFDGPQVDFSASPLLVCRNAPINFADNSTAGSGPITNWQWSFGDGNASNFRSPQHAYQQGGIYSISLVLTDVNGCTAATSKPSYITVKWPDATFTYNPSIGCVVPHRVNFFPSPSIGLTHFWSFGDGTTSINAAPTHTYNRAGVFTISHTVTDATGCSSTTTITQAISVGQSNTTLQLSPSGIICEADSIFLSCNMRNFQAITWNLAGLRGNPNQGCDLELPPQRFNPGTYTVTAVITLGPTCQVTASKTLTIEPNPDLSDSVIIAHTCNTPISALFLNTSTAPAGTTWLWEFGDGGTSTLHSPSHNYALCGIYVVSLSGTTSVGCKNKIAHRVYVANEQVIPIISADTIQGCIPLHANFNDSSIVLRACPPQARPVSPSPIVSWFWDFGNGTTSTLQNPPRQTYPTRGVDTVRLTVITDSGCVGTTAITIFRGDSVHADFTISDSVLCGSDSIVVQSTSTGNITGYTWNMGDGSPFVPNLNPYTHFYRDTGYYDITLHVTDNGCMDSLVKDSILILPAIAGFGYPPIVCDTPTTVNFINLAQGADRWHWTFGTGNPADTSNLDSPSFTFVRQGSYLVTQWVINDRTGCIDEDSVIIQVEDLELHAWIDTTFGCAPLTVNFSDSSFNASRWWWSFGDARHSFAQNIAHTYHSVKDANILINLSVWNSIGCVKRDTFWVESYQPTASFLGDTSGCLISLTQFLDASVSRLPINHWRWDFGNGTSSTLENPIATYNTIGFFDVKLHVTDSLGCVDSVTEERYIYITEPVADFFVSPESVSCIGQALHFNNRSRGQGLLLSFWDFGDGTTSTVQSPNHIYTANGSYTVSLTLSDANGCDSTVTQNVIIADPDISLAASALSAACPPLFVQFTATINSAHTFSSWLWDFGDGSNGFSQNPTNLYTRSGTYNVSLIATSLSGCIDTFYLPTPIVVNGPTGTFQFSPHSGCPGLVVNFTGQFNSTISNVADMDDGTLYNGNPLLVNFSHTYNLPGTYHPVLILDDGNGCRLPVTSPDSIVIFPPAIADFQLSDSTFCDTGRVTFSDLSQPVGNLTNWFWDFGDGTQSTTQNPIHFYTSPGNYSARLIVVTTDGCRDTLVKPIINVNKLPSPLIILSDTAGCMPFKLYASGRHNPVDAAYTDWAWEFGIGGTGSTQQVDSFTYLSAGRYRLRLTVTDTNGCVGTTDTFITVFPLPQVDFGVNDSFGCAIFNAQFRDKTPNSASWIWDFGDGGNSNDQHPLHTYLLDGVYDVSLTVVDNNGCQNSRIKPQYIHLGHPTADFISNKRVICPGDEVLFTDQSSSDTSLISWQWDFGDGQTASGNPIRHTYLQSGFYSVQLIVMDAFGCTDTIVKADWIHVLINREPIAPLIKFVTVVSDTEIRVEWEKYVDTLDDFREYILLRYTNGVSTQVIRSSDLDNLVFTDKLLSTQSQSYCYKLQIVNFCGTVSNLATYQEHCSILLKAQAGLDLIDLDWSAYVGWPKVASYDIFRVRDYNLSGMRLMATVPGNVLQWTDTTVKCYQSITYRIFGQKDSSTYRSASNISKATPTHFPDGDPLHLVRATVEEDKWVLVEWQKPRVVDGEDIILEKNKGSSWFELHRQAYADTLLPYEDHITNVKERSYWYRAWVIDSCGDKTPVGREARSIHLTAELQGGSALLDWTAYKEWVGDVKSYELSVFDEELQSFTKVATLARDQRRYLDDKTDLKQKFLCYRVRAIGGDTVSISNEACVPVKPRLFYPNTFSPNGDGINDEFWISSAFLETAQLTIFSRWGYPVFKTAVVGGKWDGKYKGKEVPEGVYVFIVEGYGYNGQKLEVKGTVTVIR